MEVNRVEAEKISETLHSISEDIAKISLNYRNTLKSLQDEWEVCVYVSMKETDLTDLLDDFHTIWNDKSAQALDPDSERALALIAVYQQAEAIQKSLKTFNDATTGVFKQLKYLVTRLKEKVRSLKWPVQRVHSISVEEPEDCEPLERHDSYSRATALSRQWDEEDLIMKVDGCLDRLGEI